MVGVTQAACASPSRPVVVVMGAPITPYVAAIVGNTGEVANLMQAGQDVHQFAVAPSQMALLERADVLVVPDLSTSPVLARLTQNRKNLHIVELSLLDGAEPLPYRTDNPWVDVLKPAAEKQTAEEKKNPLFPRKLEGFQQIATEPPADPMQDRTVDPHFWLDPERMAAIAEPLARELGNVTPAQKATYAFNARALAEHLRADVTPALQQMLATRRVLPQSAGKEELAFISAHPSYQYFIARFNLPDQGHIAARPEDYLGAATLDRLYDAAKQTRIHCLIADQKTSFVERIAELSGAKIVIVQPEQGVLTRDVAPRAWIQNDYDRTLYTVASKFQGCI